MRQDLFEHMASVEDAHWWFRGRRTIIETMVRRLGLPGKVAILDLGCGTGGNMPMLSKYGKVTGCEINPQAREQAMRRSAGEVVDGSLPDQVPFSKGSFDLIVMSDVLEHIEDHAGALKAVNGLLKPEGTLLITVPAVPWLWTERDVAHHHFRRYTRKTLRNVVQGAGLQLQKLSYFNTLLFPMALAQRLWQRIRRTPYVDDLRVPAAPVNGTLGWIMRLERHLLGRLPLPIGLSLFAQSKKDTKQEQAAAVPSSNGA